MQPFQSTPPGWEATRDDLPAAVADRFQSTPPGWEATLEFIPSIREQRLFQSTPPGWEATYSLPSKSTTQAFQSTPPGWEATQMINGGFNPLQISIHASRVGGDKVIPVLMQVLQPFQSTPPGWEATGLQWQETPLQKHFNPRLPGGRRLKRQAQRFALPRISIHASRVGGDLVTGITLRFSVNFNPRLPGGRRLQSSFRVLRSFHFNPRLPGGRRHTGSLFSVCDYTFQSTPPGWEATSRPFPRVSAASPISIHASRVGGDENVLEIMSRHRDFNPRLPGGRRRPAGYQHSKL